MRASSLQRLRATWRRSVGYSSRALDVVAEQVWTIPGDQLSEDSTSREAGTRVQGHDLYNLLDVRLLERLPPR